MANIADFSTDNSTTVLLAGGAAFVGVWEEVQHYGVISVAAFSDVASATQGFVLEFSSDQVNVVKSITKTVLGGTGDFIRSSIPAHWVRVKYTNGGVGQATFILETIKRYIDTEESASGVLNEVSPQSAVLSGFRSVASGSLKDNIGREPISGFSTNVAAETVVVMGANDGANLWQALRTTLAGLLKVETTPSGTGSTAVTIADGADVTLGAIADAADTTGIASTINAKIRGMFATFFANVIFGVSAADSNPAVKRLLADAAIRCYDGSNYTVVRNSLLANGTNSGILAEAPLYFDTLAGTHQRVQTARSFTEGGEYGTSFGCSSTMLQAGSVVAVGNVFVRERTPAVFKTIQAVAAGNTALWTPAAGRKFRLMRYMVEVTGNASVAAAGVITITLFDGAAGATGQAHDVFVPLVALAGIGLLTTGWIDLGNGYLSVAANNVLNINLSAALVTGNARVMVAGTEE